MKKTHLLIGGSLALAVLVIGVSNQVLAYQGDPTSKGEDCTTERHAILRQAFDELDYEAWQELMQDRGRVNQIITKENFDRFVEMHRLKVAGDLEGASAIAQELGLGQRGGDGEGRGFGHGKEAGFRRGKNADSGMGKNLI
jgi:hypothetical protein